MCGGKEHGEELVPAAKRAGYSNVEIHPKCRNKPTPKLECVQPDTPTLFLHADLEAELAAQPPCPTCSH